MRADDTTILRGEIAAVITAVREQRPLVHAITGTVTQPIVADGLLAAGARPMATATAAEAPALVASAAALLANLGSLGSDAALSIPSTVAAARAAGVPWVLDPAAIGLAPLRTPMARHLVSLGPDAVRGNASEILALAGLGTGGSGSDSTDSAHGAIEAAASLAREHRSVVAVSGAVDVITDGTRTIQASSGLPMLTRVIGTGCLLGALTAACVAVGAEAGASPLGRVLAATALLTVAAEQCADLGPGSFRVALLDALYAIEADDVAERVRLQWA